MSSKKISNRKKAKATVTPYGDAVDTNLVQPLRGRCRRKSSAAQ